MVVAEGATPKDGERSIVGKADDQAERLGGIGDAWPPSSTADGQGGRTVVLGHLLRGGSPTRRPPLGTRFGAAAVRGSKKASTA